MKRRRALLLALAGICLGLAALGSQNRSGLLILQWAAKAPAEHPPVAVLIELGLKDDQPTPWPGRASVSGAKVVHREGYRFRDGDKLVEPNAWQASTRRPGQGQQARNPARAALNRTGTVGVVLHLTDVQPDAALTVEVKDKAVVPLREVLAGTPKPFWDGAAVVRRISTASPVVTAKTEDDFPAAAYGPDGTLWVAYISYTVKQEDRRVGGRQMAEQPANFQSFYTPEFGDQLFVKYYRGGQWSEPIAVTGPRQDLVRCAVAVDGQGRAWVGYSANREGNYHLYVRSVRAAERGQGGTAAEPERPLTRRPAPDLSPVMCTDQSGRVWLACQSWSDKGAGYIRLFTCKDGKWADGPALPELKSGGNCWYAALAAGPDGQVAVAYDVYSEGDYDVHVAVIEGERVTDHPVATSGRFEARPAVAYDPRGRLWIAYEEGPENWGKNFGALDKGKGNPLYNLRTVRLACLDNGKLLRPAAELPAPAQQRPRQGRERTAMYSYPKLGLDGQGRVWLCYRQKLTARFGPGTAWLTVARRLDGDKWSEAIDLHHSDGLLDSRPVLLPHASGGLLILHNTDGRYTTPGQLDNQIYASVVALPGEAAEPKLVASEPGTKDGRRAAEERAAVERIRGYRLEADGKKYQLLRGEFHRHTEISGDGGNDGSLEDMFRYAIDCAALDWVGNGDHDNGGGREYTWWLIQKYSDAYQVRNAFTPMFTYERSVPYPHGHRNCMFAKRGVRTLPRLAEPDPAKRVAGIHADDAKMLYRYLRELDGICASHTSATSMGTDWRDNDPVVEPIVEIYQGDRMSYEYEDAPRSGHDPKSNKLPANIAGWFPDGFVINALKQKGYRLGFQSSSDHISTHISYCVALAERHDREGILAALKKRHSYGATDDIIVDVKSGPHLMGDEFKTDAAPTLQIAVVGTKPLAQIDILKDSSVVETIKPGKQEYKGTWTDPKPTAGVHYYYIRVLQEDEELAWGSPLWIDYTR